MGLTSTAEKEMGESMQAEYNKRQHQALHQMHLNYQQVQQEYQENLLEHKIRKIIREELHSFFNK